MPLPIDQPTQHLRTPRLSDLRVRLSEHLCLSVTNRRMLRRRSVHVAERHTVIVHRRHGTRSGLVPSSSGSIPVRITNRPQRLSISTLISARTTRDDERTSTLELKTTARWLT